MISLPKMFGVWLIYFMVCISETLSACSLLNSPSDDCFMGTCINNQCICDDGWKGIICNTCQGRVLLNASSGFIFDGPKNYTVTSKCSWLVAPTIKHNSLRLHFHEFATECGWDYLYIYDGESAFSPLIGTFNGLLSIPGHADKTISEITAWSGKAFLQFYSDAALNMAGFNISYTVDDCTQNCSQHGICRAGRCECHAGWAGDSCDLCSTNCSNELVACSSEDNDVCSCSNETCSVNSVQGLWTVSELQVFARASAAVIVDNRDIWMYGGLQFTQDRIGQLAVLNSSNQVWTNISTSSTPESRYEHTMISWNNTLVVFGGKLVRSEVTVNELWLYDMLNLSWSQVEYTASFGNSTEDLSRLKLSGHSANKIIFSNGTEIMLILFGYNPSMTYTHFVYEYDFSTRHWIMPRSTGAHVPGLFGHTSAYYAGIIYIHGGYKFINEATRITSETFSYDPLRRKFSLLTSSGQPRYLHSASFINDVMYVYGGNTHNSTYEGGEGLCYSDNFMAYYPGCDRWVNLNSPSLLVHPSRYGHASAVTHSINDPSRKQMLILSGYDSTMISNVLSYRPPSCDLFNETSCVEASFYHGILCYSNTTHCLSVQAINQSYTDSCPPLQPEEKQELCNSIRDSSCENCLSNSFECKYCDSTCYGPNNNNTSCQTGTCNVDGYCSSFVNCEQCEIAGSECIWHEFKCISRPDNETNGSPCTGNTCNMADTCSTCNDHAECMWCLQPGKCVPTNSYVMQFPYGQCMEWTKSKANCFLYKCSSHQTCDSCQNFPQCGWCEDSSRTGLGTCRDGTASGILNSTANQSQECPLWHFTSCPNCQCNGHSQCNANNECIECDDNTKGENCQTCIDGYYGNPLNGGNCTLCKCDNKATTCKATGECNCFTKGVIGYSCNICDAQNSYVGNATGNGTCYYPLQANYIYTFKLNVPVDEHITALNFQNTPVLDEDVQMSLSSEELCNVKIAVISQESSNEVTLQSYYNIRTVSYVFQTYDLKFSSGGLNTTIRIYTSNLSANGVIKVSLIQRSNTLLTVLLILFSSFLIILIIAAVVWKAKLMYDAYRMRVNRAIQMKEMAARPFAGINLCCDDVYRSSQMLLSPSMDGYSALPDDGLPDVICEEKCSDNKATVVSVFLWLPSSVPSEGVDVNSSGGDTSTCYVTPPPGMPALTIGTVLTDGKNLSTPASSPDSRRKSKPTNSRSDEVTVRNQTQRSSAYVNHAMQQGIV